MRLLPLLSACLLLTVPALATVPSPILQSVADSLSRDQCVELYRQLSGNPGRLDRPCLPLLRRWNRRSGDTPALRDALRQLGEPQLAETLVRGQDEQGAARIVDSVREVEAEAATEAAEAADEEQGEGSDDTDSRPAGQDRPEEQDAFGEAGVTLLMTLGFLTAMAVCYCAGRAACPTLARYDPAARRHRQHSVSQRVNRMLRAQRLRGKIALVTGLTSSGGRTNSEYAPVSATEDGLSVSTAPDRAPSVTEQVS